MTQIYQQIEKQALTLSPEEREILAEKLLCSVEPISPENEHLKEWREEVRKRIADVDAGRVKMIPMDEVLEELRAKYP